MADTSAIIEKISSSELPEPTAPVAPSHTRIVHGRVIPPQQQILLFSADDWEEFINEWAHAKRQAYTKVVRLSAANDMGIDVAGLTGSQAFFGSWDNFQCKHYDDPLTPGVALPEIGKMLWHSFNGCFNPPRSYAFMAPKNCGPSLKMLLLNPEALKKQLFERWDDWCRTSITKKQAVELEGNFRDYCEALDYGIFNFRPTLEVIEEHRLTPYFAARFGGGLPDRPAPAKPPAVVDANESRYIQKLYAAYGDYTKTVVKESLALDAWPELGEHFARQREHFYHAESLRTFARDNVPPGTFEELQEEVFQGVADIPMEKHEDGFACVKAVTQAAAALPLTANGLISVTKIQDKRGICHQLANADDDRLRWVKP